MPPFWPNEPALWFAQLEGQFMLSNITADATKFNHVIANLDYKFVCEVKDIISKPPADNKYDKIKTELIARLSASQEQRVRQLLTHEELGDRKSSQILRHLRNLAGTEVPDDFIRSLWTNRLPSHVQAIIAAQADPPLDTMALIVDKIYEIALQPSSQIASTSAAPPATTAAAATCPLAAIEQLTRRVEDLARQVSALSNGSRSSSRTRTQSPGWRRRSRSRSDAGADYCWYHRRFGKKSTKCRDPCAFNQGNGSSSQ